MSETDRYEFRGATIVVHPVSVSGCTSSGTPIKRYGFHVVDKYGHQVLVGDQTRVSRKATKNVAISKLTELYGTVGEIVHPVD